MWKHLNFQLFCFCYSVVNVGSVFTEAQPGSTLTALCFEIETNNNIRTVQSESSKFASLLFDQILNRRVVGTDRHAICWYFASIRLCLALLFIISIVEVFRTILNLSCKVFYSHEISFLNLQTFRELMLYLFFTKRFTIDLINFEAFDALRQTIFRST